MEAWPSSQRQSRASLERWKWVMTKNLYKIKKNKLLLEILSIIRQFPESAQSWQEGQRRLKPWCKLKNAFKVNKVAERSVRTTEDHWSASGCAEEGRVCVCVWLSEYMKVDERCFLSSINHNASKQYDSVLPTLNAFTQVSHTNHHVAKAS